jgi:hypothetical protein
MIVEVEDGLDEFCGCEEGALCGDAEGEGYSYKL